MNNQSHKMNTDPAPPHHCYFCKAIMPDNHCGNCRAEHSFRNEDVVSIKLYVKIKKSACFLYINPLDQRAEMLMDCKYLPISWEIAQDITPENIKNKLERIDKLKAFL